jgi:tRNA-dihydrouridine synthase B
MKPFYIEHIKVDPPVVLAPMEGVTDRPFRTLVRSLGGCGLAVTEFISSEAMTRDVGKAWQMAELDPNEHPVSIQIYGRDPARMADAARHCQALGADIVDINLGCPSKTVVSGCAGSALMKEPELSKEIFDAVSEAITIPMTVKMRLGWDHHSINAPELAYQAARSGAKMVTVHGRTRSDQYKGRARWDLIRHVKDAIDVPLLVNGDIRCPDSALRALEQSGADGVMVGRGVMTDPWTLRHIASALSGDPYPGPTLTERRLAIQGYLDRLEHDGLLDTRTLIRIKQVVGYFSKGLSGASVLRRQVQLARDFSHIRTLVDQFFPTDP